MHAPTKGQAEVYSHEGARVARALELTGGELVTLDLDRRVVGFGKPGVAPSPKGAREGALGELFSPARLDEPFGLKLSLGLGDGGAPLLVAYAPTSGQLTVAPIDVGGAQVRGASRSLPSLAGLDVDPRCVPGASALRTVLELPVALELTEPGAPSKVSATYGALVLVRVGDARVCVEGLELDTPGAQGLHLALANTPDKVRARAYRGLVDAAATCTLSPRAPSAPRR